MKGIRNRLPKTAENLKQLEDKFIDGTEKLSLKSLSLDELAHRYKDIDQQSQMLKGQILLEARERFKSDKEFGQWIVSVGLSDTSRDTRSTYMNLARFFKDRDLTGISVTAAYEISAPKNSDVADEIYELAKGNNLSVSEIKQQIAIRKGANVISPKTTNADKSETQEKQIDLESELIALIDSRIKNPTLAIKILKDCIEQYQKRFGYTR